MRVIILDPGLMDTQGHHFHTDLAVYKEFEDRGIPTTILGHREVESQIRATIPVIPFFRSIAYPKRDGQDCGNLRANFETYNQMVYEDLMTYEFPPFDSEDLILVPTARDIHLSGLYKWFEQLADPKPRICIRLMFPPEFRSAPSERKLAVELSTRQLRDWSRLPSNKLILASESDELSGVYEKLCEKTPITLPLIVRYPLSKRDNVISQNLQSPKHFVVLGEARKEKGAHLIPDAFRKLFLMYPDIKLTVQTSCLYDIDDDFIEDLQQLSPQVEFQTEALHEDSYDKCLRSADVVLLPYDPTFYAKRTSLIFLEAAGAGIPILTTAGTWMQSEMQRLGLDGTFIERFDSQSISEAVIKMMNDWPATLSNSVRTQDAFRKNHNPTNFVDSILDICESRSLQKTVSA